MNDEDEIKRGIDEALLEHPNLDNFLEHISKTISEHPFVLVQNKKTKVFHISFHSVELTGVMYFYNDNKVDYSFCRVSGSGISTYENTADITESSDLIEIIEYVRSNIIDKVVH